MSEQECDSTQTTNEPATNVSSPMGAAAERFIGITSEFFKTYADLDYIFVAIDFEKACSVSDAKERISECGICAFDTRHVMGKDPGDRGIQWQHTIQGFHFRTREVPHKPNYRGGQHGGWCKSKTAAEAFLFGRSEWVNLANYSTRIRHVIDSYHRKGLTAQQLAAGERRKLVSICWDSRLERQLDVQHGLGIWQAISQHWDLQIHPEFGGKLNHWAGINKQ